MVLETPGPARLLKVEANARGEVILHPGLSHEACQQTCLPRLAEGKAGLAGKHRGGVGFKPSAGTRGDLNDWHMEQNPPNPVPSLSLRINLKGDLWLKSLHFVLIPLELMKVLEHPKASNPTEGCSCVTYPFARHTRANFSRTLILLVICLRVLAFCATQHTSINLAAQHIEMTGM